MAHLGTLQPLWVINIPSQYLVQSEPTGCSRKVELVPRNDVPYALNTLTRYDCTERVDAFLTNMIALSVWYKHIVEAI